MVAVAGPVLALSGILAPVPGAAEEPVVVAGEGIGAEIERAPFRLRILDGDGVEVVAERGGGDWMWRGLSYSTGFVLGGFLQPLETSLAFDVDLWSFALDRVQAVEAVPGGVRLTVSTTEPFGLRSATVTVTSPGARRLRVAMELSSTAGVYRLRESFAAPAGEHYSGFGERFGDSYDQRGRSFVLGSDRFYTGPELFGFPLPVNDHFPVPFLVSSRGYGISVRNSSKGVRFDLASRNAAVASFGVPAGTGPLAYDVYVGDPTRVLADYTADTGRSRVLPEWAYGVWKGHDRDPSQAEALDQFDQWRDHAMPLDVAMIDSPWETTYNTWEWNPEQFPDAQGMLDTLRRLGTRPIVWNSGWINTDSRAGDRAPGPLSEAWASAPAANYAPAAAAGLFVRNPDGTPHVGKWWMGTGSILDFTNPATRTYWVNTLRPVLDMGVYGVKADGEEGHYLPDGGRLSDGRSGREAAWSLTVPYREATDAALRAAHGDDHVSIMRSGWTGSQGEGGIWGGDQFSTPTGLRQVVVAMLTAAASGISNWQTDAGGYFGRVPTLGEIIDLVIRNPGVPVDKLFGGLPPTKAVLVRWVQAATMNPTFEMFSKAALEPWLYDAETEAIVREYALLHQHLVPYIRAAARVAHETGVPVVRPLGLLQPDDARAWATPDAWLFGDSIYAAPVLDPDATSRSVYLPAGEWVDWWSGDLLAGGTTVTAPAPLARLPLYVRAGAVVPTYPDDVTTLTPGTDPRAVSPAGRLDVRVWRRGAVPVSTLTLADGSAFTASPGSLLWTGTPAASLLVRMPLAEAPAAVTAGGSPVGRAASVADVRTSRSGWFFDAAGGEIWVGVPGGAGGVVAG